MSMHQLFLKNKEGNTVLSISAIVGNVQAGCMIMKKDENQTLIQDSNKSKRIPLIQATRHGQKKMINYLLQFSNNYLDYDSATRFTSGVLLVKLLITAEFYDLALDLIKKHPSLATMTFHGGESLLSEITKKPSAFPSGRTKRLPFWGYVGVSKETKLMSDYKVLELVKHLCKVIADDRNDYRTTSLILKRPLLLGAEMGVCEIVEEIIKSYPDAIWFTNENNQNLFHLAVMNRQEKVFKLIYQMTDHKHLLLQFQDVDKNNILHLAGKLAPENKLNVIAGAAFQMQRVSYSGMRKERTLYLPSAKTK
ncbi:hypothetical protein Pint_11958 [Pistacia integerrima]|uniref:Uncharacterized protein n=1 Tax=Pistacia integerrima TaxID=434235 RepID=A0ACC0XFM7_9ROSI|nr:hypothetical protein Pint_11958 [Pistacia integerrima]